jgi:O-antigen/teichoic acid export membrane protein
MARAGQDFARGAAWAALDAWGQMAGGLLALLLVGRAVGPAALGLMAMAQLLLALMMAGLLDGFSDALVQRRRITRAHVDSAFWLLVGLGGAAGLALAALAWPAAWLFGAPALAPLLWLLAPGLPLVGASAALQGVLQRQRRFRLLALRTLLAQCGGLAAALWLARHGAGVEALAAQFLVARLLDAAILLAAGARPGLAVARPALRRILGFGQHRVRNQLLGFVVMQADRFSVALLLGPLAIGVYAVAERIAGALVNGLAGAATRAALPVLAARQSERAAFGDALAEVMLALNLLAMPALVGLAVVAGPLLSLLMDDRWAGAALPLSLLALAGVPHALNWLLSTAANARGRPEPVARAGLLVAPLRIAASLAAAPFGLLAVTAANLAVTACSTLLLLHILREVVPEGAAAVRRSLGLPLVGTAAMAAAVLGLAALLPPLPPLPRLAAEVATGVAAYAAALVAAAPAGLRARLAGRISRRVAAPPVAASRG